MAIDCPWRISGADGVFVGHGDNDYTAGEPPDLIDNAKPEPAQDRLGERLIEFNARHCPTRVSRVEVDAVGGFCLILENGFSVEAFVCDSAKDEQWRIFSATREKLLHHVVFADNALRTRGV